MKPFILVMALNVLLEFSGAICWRPYIIQVIKAYGVPLDVHTAAMILSSTSIAGGLCFLLCVKLFGKRRLYLTSTAIVVLCCISLGENCLQNSSVDRQKIKNFIHFFAGSRHLWHRFLSTQLDFIQKFQQFKHSELWAHSKCCRQLWTFGIRIDVCYAFLHQPRIECSTWRFLWNGLIFSMVKTVNRSILHADTADLTCWSLFVQVIYMS